MSNYKNYAGQNLVYKIFESAPKNHKEESNRLNQILIIYNKIKKNYKFFKYIDDSYLKMLKEEGYLPGDGPFFELGSRQGIRCELRNAICNALLRYVVLETYSIFYDEYKGTIANKVITLINNKKPQFFKEYLRLKTSIKDYRNNVLAHKKDIYSHNYGCSSEILCDLVKNNETMITWYIEQSSFISDDHKLQIIDYYTNDSIDYRENKAIIDFFIKSIAGLSPREIVDLY